jgi:AcrR family transcriptional regulator
VSERNGTCVEDPGKRQAILEEAIRTFAELGFRRADVQVIADHAGVGKGTVYRYFRSKEELFWAATLELIVRLDRHIFASMEGVEGACAKLRASAIAHADFFEANPQCLQLFIQERAEFQGAGPESHREQHEKMLDRMSVVLREGIESGELRPVDTRQTTLAMGCLLFGTAMLAGHVESVDLKGMTRYAVDIFLKGIRKDAPLDNHSRHERIRHTPCAVERLEGLASNGTRSVPDTYSEKS